MAGRVLMRIALVVLVVCAVFLVICHGGSSGSICGVIVGRDIRIRLRVAGSFSGGCMAGMVMFARCIVRSVCRGVVGRVHGVGCTGGIVRMRAVRGTGGVVCVGRVRTGIGVI